MDHPIKHRLEPDHHRERKQIPHTAKKLRCMGLPVLYSDDKVSLKQAQVQRRFGVEFFLEDVNLGADRLALLQGLQNTTFHGPVLLTLADIAVQPVDDLIEMFTISDRDAEGMRGVLFLEVHGRSLGGSLLVHITLSVKLSC